MIIEIFQVLLLASASALCIALVFYIARITKSIEKIHADINRMTDEIRAILQSVEALTESISKITTQAENQIKSVAWIVDAVKSRVVSILEMEKKIKEGIEGPIQNLTDNLYAIKKGISTFVQRLKF